MMKHIGEYTLKEIFGKAKKAVVYVALFIVVAFSAVVYAAWSDAQTGGSGRLTELNWNSLITQLQTSISAIPTTPSSPGNWTCRQVKGSTPSTVLCIAPERFIAGGCTYSDGTSVAAPPYEYASGSGNFGALCGNNYLGSYIYCCK